MEKLLNYIDKLEKDAEIDKLKAMTSWDSSRYNFLDGEIEAFKMVRLLIKTNCK